MFTESHSLAAPLHHEFQEHRRNNSTTNQARQQREALREVNIQLGATQRPLGPGAPPLRSEIAGENDNQLPGPVEAGGSGQINQVQDAMGALDWAFPFVKALFI